MSTENPPIQKDPSNPSPFPPKPVPTPAEQEPAPLDAPDENTELW